MTRKLVLFLTSSLFAIVAQSAIAQNCVLRQSDAVEIALGPYVDATDGVTAETGLTISQGDVILKKCAAAGDCGASAQKTESGACAHDANGMYECDLDTTDTNTVGILEIWSFESGAAPVFRTCSVVETAIYDNLYADGIGGIATAAALDAVDNFVDTEVADILTDTGTTLDDFLDTEIATLVTQTSAATLQSEANDALVANHLDHLLAATYDPSAEFVADSLLSDLIENDGGVTRFNANALETAPTGSGESLEAIADAVWDELLAGHVISDSAGEHLATASSAAGLDAAGVRAAVGLASANLDTQLTNIDNFVDTEVADILTDTGTTLDDFLDTEIADIRRAIGPATTTIASLSSQTSFTLTAGSADDNAYNGWGIVIVDASSAVQTALGCVSDYIGTSKTITLAADPAIFTMANTDNVILLPAYCTSGVDVDTIEGVDATDQLDTHAAAGLDAAEVRAAVGLASANLDTQLTTIDDFLDTEVAAILQDTGTTLDDFLDTEIAAILVDTGTTLQGELDAIEADVDAILVDTSTTLDDFLDTEVAAILADTDEVQTTLAAGGTIESLVDDLPGITTSVGTISTAVGTTIPNAIDAVDNFVDTEITALLNARTQLFPGGADADSVLTADSGDTDTLVDTELTFSAAQDIDGAYVVREDGQRCFVDSFTPATDTIEFGSCTFTGAWSTQTYKLYPAGTQ